MDNQAVGRPFIIHALPRSRTAWLSSFLSYRDWQCGHEQAIFLRSVADIKSLFALPNTGTVETASAQAWRIIKHHVPDIKMAVIRRPIDEVMESMLAVDLGGYAHYDVPRLRKVMEYGNRMLDEVSQQDGVLTLDFAELDEPQGISRLFEFCLPYKFDVTWWLNQQAKNIQADVPGAIRYYHENRPAIEAFKSDLWSEMRALVRVGHIPRKEISISAFH